MSDRSVSFRRPLRGLSAAAVVFVLGACASIYRPSSGEGGDRAGTSAHPVPAARQDLSGRVRNIDHGNRRLLLERDAGGTADIAWDDRTRLTHDGRAQAVAGLEPGAPIRVLASRDGALWRADDIEMLDDAPAGGAQAAPTERSGAIASIDRRARTIAYTRGGYTGGEERVRYDRDTVVQYRGQRHPVDALERGDLVRLQLRRSDQGWVAVRIVVEASARER